jgi:metal-responsive CopG/Arc/MetJ family transcriptional regulator
MDAVLAEKEKRADLIRDAVEREIKRRERQPKPHARKSRSKPSAI